MKPCLILHAGVFKSREAFARGDADIAVDHIKAIIEAGYTLLNEGRSSMDVVEHCVRLLEDDPLYNAGRGGRCNREGEYELDASIMDGITLKAGAVGAVKNIANPVSLARMVKEKSPHLFMVAEGAKKFAVSQGMELKPDEYFQTEYTKLDKKDDRSGTVGAVAYDVNGNIAAATSTGGHATKMPGRIGDSPIIGAGTYANNKSCGVSATGCGEDFIRTSFANRVSFSMEWQDKPIQDALQTALDYLVETCPDTIGAAIGIGKNGKIGIVSTTGSILHAYADQSGNVHASFDI